MKSRNLKTAAFFLLLVITSLPVKAGYDYKFDTRDVPMGQFESEISGKLTRGVTNVLYGWTEIGRTPVRLAEGPQHPILAALAVGIPYGILRAAVRTVVGVYEIVTCYAPQGPIMRPIEGDVV